MKIISSFSTQSDADKIAEELAGAFSGHSPKAVIIFSSVQVDQTKLNKRLSDLLGGAVLFGCSTSGEITSGRMLKGAVSAMALTEEVVDDIHLEVLENLREEPSAQRAAEGFEKYFGESFHHMDMHHYVGIVLADGLSGAEERLMESLGDLTNVNFVGGSAGDDLKFEKTFVYANGKVLTNAAVLVLMRIKGAFDIIKTQSFEAMGKQLTVTRVDEKSRCVEEFDGSPAVKAYAEALDIAEEQAGHYFMSSPVGLVSGQDIFVRSPQRTDAGRMFFYCSMPVGMQVSLLKSTDIIEDTRQAVEKSREQLGGISGLINFNCILRTLELEQEKLTETYGEIFRDIPTAGFSTYGEAYIGHINQTATMIVFG